MEFAQFITGLGTGGGARAVIGLASALAEAGHVSHIFTYERHIPVEGGARVHVIPGKEPDLPVLIGPLTSLERDFRLEAVSLEAVILSGVFVPSNARLAKLLVGQTTIVAAPMDPYTDALFTSRYLLKTAYWISVERRYLRSCDALQVMASDHLRILRDRGVATPGFVSAGALGPRDLVGATRALSNRERTDNKAPLKVGYLGRFDIYKKGIDLFLTALGGDLDLRTNLTFTLAGPISASERAQLGTLLARDNLNDLVSHVGPVNDIWDYLAGLDLLVLPSRVEGFGLVAIEALASGLPVLLSDVAGATSVLAEEAAVLCVPTVEGIRSALHTAIDQRVLLCDTAISRAPTICTRFSWSAVAEQWIKDFKAL